MSIDPIKAVVSINSGLKHVDAASVTVGVGSALTLVDGVVILSMIVVPEDCVVGTAHFTSAVQGSFTGDNENAIGIYRLNGNLIELVAKTANSANTWKAAAGDTSAALTAPVALTPGIYYSAALYNNSAQTTAPQISGHTTYFGDLGGGAVFRGGITSQTALAASYAVSSIAERTSGPHIQFV